MISIPQEEYETTEFSEHFLGISHNTYNSTMYNKNITIRI